MLDTSDTRVIVLRQPKKQPKKQPKQTGDLPADPDRLRRRCLHPAEAWVLKRRAGRPPAPPCRLPVVARSG